MAEPAGVSVVLPVSHERVNLERLHARLTESRALAGFAHSHDPILVTLDANPRTIHAMFRGSSRRLTTRTTPRREAAARGGDGRGAAPDDAARVLG